MGIFFDDFPSADDGFDLSARYGSFDHALHGMIGKSVPAFLYFIANPVQSHLLSRFFVANRAPPCTQKRK
jgi:hypothetical protein